ncbi:inositol polyphosphate multikinase [Fopius arisanus]|uniref:Kinase n=1 Tax=Fopius arisanus TaxID=64838 RepID=A0A9R1T417_9HYME|nr:PREDICTED: inositol polyphosphate multikinase [Fopius arisanus]
MTDETMNLPSGMRWLASQVAGHHSDLTKNRISMIETDNGCVLKAGQREDLQLREVSFYENIKNSNESLYNELSMLTPKYYGTRELELGERRIEFIILEDMTVGMTEPCVMDVKIGERTWDPLATREKRAAEEMKYVDSKKAYGFCIPGFQVYDLSTRNLRKFGKDYGKTLNKDTIVDAFRIFLNAEDDSNKCGILLEKLINRLNKIKDFSRKQKTLRFYSSSILITYDANYLRRRAEELSCSPENKSSLTEECAEEMDWVRVRMIDFTHIFPAEEETLDTNYLRGITNLVQVLESFLK